nr:integrase core domain-containing protein [Ferrimicrobium acidiphilum]
MPRTPGSARPRLRTTHDLFSDQIVGYEVYENESSHQLATVVQRSTLNEGGRAPNILHSDNGSPMKGVSLLELCYQLGIVTSNSRPRVSDDNPHIEALFRTTKYWPGYPYGGFSNLVQARVWVAEFVDFYNNSHRHSALKFVTPNEVHTGVHLEILQNRSKVYEKARLMRPGRWIQNTIRNWNPATETWTTPMKEANSGSGLLRVAS